MQKENKRKKIQTSMNMNFDKKQFYCIDKNFREREFRKFLIVNNILEIDDIQQQNHKDGQKDEWGLVQNDYIYIKSRLLLRYSQAMFLEMEKLIIEKNKKTKLLRNLKERVRKKFKKCIKTIQKRVNQFIFSYQLLQKLVILF